MTFDELLDLLAGYTEEYTRAFKQRKTSEEMDRLRVFINDILVEIDQRRRSATFPGQEQSTTI